MPFGSWLRIVRSSAANCGGAGVASRALQELLPHGDHGRAALSALRRVDLDDAVVVAIAACAEIPVVVSVTSAKQVFARLGWR